MGMSGLFNLWILTASSTGKKGELAAGMNW